MINKFNSFIEKLNRVNELLLVSSLLIMFIVLLAQIFSRFIFFIPLPSSQDILVFLLITSVFLGAGTAVATHRHIALEFLVILLPSKIKTLVLACADVISIIFLSIVVYQSYILMGMTKGTIIGASPIPAEGYYAVVLMGCVIMILNYVSDLTKKINGIFEREERN